MKRLMALLAVYRVAYLIAAERGPFDVAIRLRTVIAERYGDQHWMTAGVNCPLCISFWLAFAVRVAPAWLVEALGLAGGALVIHRGLEALDAEP